MSSEIVKMPLRLPPKKNNNLQNSRVMYSRPFFSHLYLVLDLDLKDNIQTKEKEKDKERKRSKETGSKHSSDFQRKKSKKKKKGELIIGITQNPTRYV